MRHSIRPSATVLGLAWIFTSPALAQDIRGLEVCTAEKQMERRTSCLQANTDFLQQSLERHRRDAQRKQAAADAEIAALKDRIAKLEADLVNLKKAAAPASKDGAAPKK
jgi:predicted  nucleic acid-binding Zn-ribbon protein